jgi:trans-aconitate 2-methyltransferase
MADNDVAAFYDDYVDLQNDSGINDRVYGLYKKMLEHGLKSQSNVLELGCGIGTLTYLIAKKVKKGTIESVDISPKSIAFAKGKLKQQNIHFNTHDAVHYMPKMKNYDFITLFDLIEHIPIIEHHILFESIAKVCHEQTLVLINIPSPESIIYDRQYKPETLQIIDQEIYLSHLLPIVEKYQLTIVKFEQYNIWAKGDYNFIILKKQTPFTDEKLSATRSIVQKITNKMRYYFLKTRYQY